MKREQIYISTISDVTENETTHELCYRSHAAPVAKRFGFGLELAEYCISENMDNDTGVRTHFLNNVLSAGRKILHAPYNELYPHAIDPKAVQLARDRFSAALEICEKAGCSKLIAHANFVPALYHPLWFTERQILFWKDFLCREDPSVTICLENVMEPEPELLTEIIDGVADSRLRICLDVGHANLMPVKPEQWIRVCGRRVSHFHLHNNSGPRSEGWPCLADTHSALNRGTIDMRALLQYALQTVPDATCTLETGAAEESAVWLLENGFIPNP